MLVADMVQRLLL